MPTVMDGSDYDLHFCRSQVKDRLEFDSEDGRFWVTILSTEGERATDAGHAS
jgi:hypothetical protein